LHAQRHEETAVRRPLHASVHARTFAAIGAAALAVVALLAPVDANAQGAAWPNRPIRFIVPFPPGGGAEATARIVAQKMSESLGQPMVIETRPGAGGNIGTEAVFRAPPDGYTVLFTTNGHAVQPHLRPVPWDALRDWAPVGLICTYPLVIAAHPSVPAQNLKELVALARSQPGKLNYGSSGNGGPLHLAAEMFKSQVAIDVVHVPYKGNAPMTIAVLAGEVNVVFDSLTGPLPNIRAGKLRALAVTGKKRVGVLPDVPTVIETGVANFDYEAWNGVLLPAAAPREAVQRLNAELVRALGLPEVRERLTALGYDPAPTTTEQFGAILANDLKRFGEVVKSAGIKAD
jgi:tripartite-type tricarboxylate transporter receptor subunit TctC